MTETDVARYAAALRGSAAALQRLEELRGWTRAAAERLGVGLDVDRVTFPHRDSSGVLVGLGRYRPNQETRRDDEPKMTCVPGSRRELFPRVETLDEHALVWLVEGEPDAVRAHSLGLAATGLPGVKSWRSEWAERFTSRRVVVCLDADAPGREAAQRVAADLAEHAAEVRVLDLTPHRDDGYDLSDLTTSAKTAEEREQARRLLEDSAERAPLVHPPQPGDGAKLLDELAAFLRRYVVMTDAQLAATALWVLHSHAFAAAEATPYLHVTSAEKESGKSRLLEVLELVAARPLKTSGTTAAALARSVAKDPPPTLLLDESDNTFKREREYVATLMGILNDGYRRGGRTLLCLPPNWAPTFLPVFAAKAIAGIGELPDTLASRTIRVELKRRAPEERVERFRHRVASAAAVPLREALAGWALAHEDTLAQARPELPDELGDRAQDCWEPLLAIADHAGGGWPQRARAAAVALSSQRPSEDDSLGVRLLGDVRAVFDGRDRLPTSELLDGLHALAEAPWADWYGKPLSPRVLAEKLKPYGVRPSSIKQPDGSTPKGYLRTWFTDAFSRYLPHESATSATLAQPSQKQALSDPQPDGSVADSGDAANPHGYAEVAAVADSGAGGHAAAEIERLAGRAKTWGA